VKLPSTGALDAKTRAVQDRRYDPNRHYDAVIIGTGMSALTTACLLANAGQKICMIEAHDSPGGMAHSFRMGKYHFCAQVHYIWGCAPGERMYEFLRKIGLEKEVTFAALDPKGYDRVRLPDGKKVFIPCGFDRLVKNIDQAYPGQGASVRKFTDLVHQLHAAIERLPDGPLSVLRLIGCLPWMGTLIRYRNKTVQEVLDECRVPREAQAVLVADAGDFMAPPCQLSMLAYCQLFSGYNSGAYYPTRHFRFLTERLAQFVTDHDGHIFYETEVGRINVGKAGVESVESTDGKVFKGNQFVCNMDPQKAAGLIGWERFPRQYEKPLRYDYSPSGIMIYLGLDGVNLLDAGFGRFNTWHLEQWDMNAMWEDQRRGDFSRPWVFVSTPSLHTADHGTTPPGGQVMEVATYCEFDDFARLKQTDTKAYLRAKNELADRLLDVVERDYLPDLRQHIAVKVVGTPLTHADYCRAPMGNAYGSMLTPRNISLGRLDSRTPFQNLLWCNASSGYAGVHGCIGNGIGVYAALTGDHFFPTKQRRTDEELAAALHLLEAP
jgi:all-trans-retinol 13,14-reductase